MGGTGVIDRRTSLPAIDADEGELVERAAAGDRGAFTTLYLRHRTAARRVAGHCTTCPADADDAVGEAIVRVFAALPRMAERELPFRPYLLAAVRNAAMDGHRRSARIDLRNDTYGDTYTAGAADEGALAVLDHHLLGEALEALPVRWREVLWLTEIEGLSPLEISRRIGIKPNAVAALAYRSRRGFRSAYLQAHLQRAAAAHPDCRPTVGRLARYVRGELEPRERAVVADHLDGCQRCRAWAAELSDVSSTMRHGFLPLGGLLASLTGRVALPAGELAAGAGSGAARKVLAGALVAVAALAGHITPDGGVDAAASHPSAVAAPAVVDAGEPIPLGVAAFRPGVGSGPPAVVEPDLGAGDPLTSAPAGVSGTPIATGSAPEPADPNRPGATRSSLTDGDDEPTPAVAVPLPLPGPVPESLEQAVTLVATAGAVLAELPRR